MMQLTAISSPAVSRAKLQPAAPRLAERPSTEPQAVRFSGNGDDFIDKAKEVATKVTEPYTKLAPKQKAVVNGGAAAVAAALTVFGPLGWLVGGGITAGLAYNAYRNWNKDKK